MTGYRYSLINRFNRKNKILIGMLLMVFICQNVVCHAMAIGDAAHCLSSVSIFKLFENKKIELEDAFFLEARLTFMRDLILSGITDSALLCLKDEERASADFRARFPFDYNLRVDAEEGGAVFLMDCHLYEDEYGDKQTVVFYNPKHIPWGLLKKKYGVTSREGIETAKRGFLIVPSEYNDREHVPAKLEQTGDGSMSGGLKKVGSDIDEETLKALKVFEVSWAKRAKGRRVRPMKIEIQLANSMRGENKIVLHKKFRVIEVNDMPERITSWNMRCKLGKSGLSVIVLPKGRYYAPYYNEMMFHAGRMFYWMENGKDRRRAQILAAGELVLAFMGKGVVTPYHRQQIMSMSVEELQKLIKEYESGSRQRYNYKVLGENARELEANFGEGAVEKIKAYERTMIEEARKRLHFLQNGLKIKGRYAVNYDLARNLKMIDAGIASVRIMKKTTPKEVSLRVTHNGSGPAVEAMVNGSSGIIRLSLCDSADEILKYHNIGEIRISKDCQVDVFGIIAQLGALKDEGIVLADMECLLIKSGGDCVRKGSVLEVRMGCYEANAKLRLIEYESPELIEISGAWDCLRGGDLMNAKKRADSFKMRRGNMQDVQRFYSAFYLEILKRVAELMEGDRFVEAVKLILELCEDAEFRGRAIEIISHYVRVDNPDDAAKRRISLLDVMRGNIPVKSVKSRRKFEKVFRNLSEEDISKLRIEVSRIDRGCIAANEDGLRGVLEGWFNIPQLTEALGLSPGAIRMRLDRGAEEAKSFVKVSEGYFLCHPIKSMLEYIEFDENRDKIEVEKGFLSTIRSMSEGDRKALSLYAGLEAEETDPRKIFEACRGFSALQSLAAYLGITRENTLSVIEESGTEIFRISPEGGKIYIIISPKEAEKIRKYLSENVFQDIENWYSEKFADEKYEKDRKISLGTFHDMDNWVKLEDLRKMFPFLGDGERYFEVNSSIRKYKMLKYKSGYFVPPAEVKRLKVMVVGWIIDDNNWEALKAYHLIGEGFEKEDMTFEEAADIIAKVQEQWMTKVQFLSASGRSAKVVDTCMINRKICGVRFGMFQPRDSIFVPREELDKLQNVDDDELQKAKVFLESRPEYGIRAESLNVVRSLIDEHCVTNAYIVEVLSEFEISGIEGRVVKSSEFAAKVIQLRFTGESAPSTYWFRDDADKFIENERNKFKVIKEKVSGLMPGRGEILDIVKPADLIVLLEKEKWLSPRDAVGLLNKDYNAVMRDIYSGKLPSVTVNLCGFHKRVFIPPTALAGTHVIDAPNKAIDKSV